MDIKQFILFQFAAVLFIGTLLIDLHTDIKKWNNGNNPVGDKKNVSHVRGFLLRLIGLIPCIILLRWPSFIEVGFLYWYLFDGLYNKWRGFDWWFTGGVDTEDAKSDKLLRKIPLKWVKVIKIGGCILGVIIYDIIMFVM